ncbi:putative hemolysin [Providencia huaxiensis]|uniref:putative hemolysin n=1 Tax=Providencia huaxiensis TaxID=2027290 RepID=UPI0034E5C93D
MKKILVLAGLAIISGCLSNVTEMESKNVGIANPASVYCEQIGGTVEIENTADGQVGYCILPSGERVEEWALYRQNKH